jgi:hypothetical protein
VELSFFSGPFSLREKARMRVLAEAISSPLGDPHAK